MGFAEQLAARAAERQSTRNLESCNNSVASSSTAASKKKRRPRIQPVSDEEYAARTASNDGGNSGKLGVKVSSNAAEKTGGAPSNLFADQLKRKAAQGSAANQSRGSVNEVSETVDTSALPPLSSLDHVDEEAHEVAAPIPVQMQRSDTQKPAASNINYEQMQATWSAQVHNLQSIDSNANVMHQMLKSGQQQTNAAAAAVHSMNQSQPYASNNEEPSAHDMHQMLQRSQPKQHLVRDMHQLLKKSKVDNFEPDSTDPHHVPPTQQPQLQRDSSNGPTSQVFGAWAQIESLKQRLTEAEERADRECRRAELAELRNFGGETGSAAPRNQSGVAASQRKSVGDVVGDSNVELNKTATKEQTGGGAGERAYKLEESGESLETVALGSDDKALASPQDAQRSDFHPNNQNHLNANNEELLRWKQRALQAEERLNHHDFASFVSPHASSTTTHFQSSQKQHHQVVESDLIQLKNDEISILRHQISRLELQIQEECARSAELPQSYHHEPPIAVAECASLSGGGDRNGHEFRMLRNEIRYLQYQLSRKNNRSTQSTTGSTLSSLENEHEEEVDGEDENDGGQHASSWGLCCVRRSRRGYGRVTR